MRERSVDSSELTGKVQEFRRSDSPDFACRGRSLDLAGRKAGLDEARPKGERSLAVRQGFEFSESRF